MTIRAASDRSFLITTGDGISEAVHIQTLRVTRALSGLPGITNLHPAYASVLVEFDLRRSTHRAMEAAIRQRIESASHEPLPETRRIEIPVRYGGAEGPDLDAVAEHCGLTPAEVIRLHSSADYLVYFLGFSPGFPYLGGMPPRLIVPRLSTPRREVPAGSVAIGGSQAGIYPVASPGGWRIIGRTPIRLFRPEDDPPVLLGMGDRLRFVPAEGEF